MADSINDFRGEYFFLSNFFPCRIVWAHEPYPSLEHAYQASKTLDLKARYTIQAAPDAKTAKQWGSNPAITKVRRDWDKVKLEFMRRMLEQKFEIPVLKRRLQETGDRLLIENNFWHDIYWGCCWCKEHRGKGDNHLGKLLMGVREDL